MLGTTLQKIEEALGEIATAVSKHSTILLITKMKAFPKITLNPDKNEAISHATDELIRCQRALNNARRHLTNLGIEPELPIDNTPPMSKLNQYAQHPNKIPLDQPTKVIGKRIDGSDIEVYPTIIDPNQYSRPGHGSEEKTTQSTQSSQSPVRQPIRTDVPRVLGKPIGLPDNLSPHSES